jgi:hypothetical protein
LVLSLNDLEVSGQEPDVDSAAKAIFNHITGGKWKEYQEKFGKGSANE